MGDDLKERARKLYRPPFRYDGSYIWDDNGEMLADTRGPDGSVLRVRGWGRLANVAQSPEEAAALQDAYGELLAEALTRHWNESGVTAGEAPPTRKHGSKLVDYDDAIENPALAEAARIACDTPLVRACNDALQVVAEQNGLEGCDEDCCMFPRCLAEGCPGEPATKAERSPPCECRWSNGVHREGCLFLRPELALAVHTLDEWHEDYGAVLWWKFPVEEPPYCGSPLNLDFPDYVTHWTQILVPPDGHHG